MLPDSRLAPAIFGYTLESEVPLHFSREGGGESPLTIALGPAGAERPGHGLVIEWPLKGGTVDVGASLYEVPGGYEFWTTDAGRFCILPDAGRIEVPPLENVILREQRMNGVPMALAFSLRGDFALHAAAVEVGGEAVLLAAPSRFGKSTLAMAFHLRGYPMLAEDLICVRPEPASVLPGPAVIRLRPDVYSGTPPAGLIEVARQPDRVFLAPSPGSRGTTSPRPLRAVVFLREGPEIRVSRAPAFEAVRDLWHLNFRLPTAEAREASFRNLTRLMTALPAWNLERPFRLDALDATIDAIVDQA